eukprot:6181287-Pleurochrysis_carterae.AAC.1
MEPHTRASVRARRCTRRLHTTTHERARTCRSKDEQMDNKTHTKSRVRCDTLAQVPHIGTRGYTQAQTCTRVNAREQVSKDGDVCLCVDRCAFCMHLHAHACIRSAHIFAPSCMLIVTHAYAHAGQHPHTRTRSGAGVRGCYVRAHACAYARLRAHASRHHASPRGIMLHPTIRLELGWTQPRFRLRRSMRRWQKIDAHTACARLGGADFGYTGMFDGLAKMTRQESAFSRGAVHATPRMLHS